MLSHRQVRAVMSSLIVLIVVLVTYPVDLLRRRMQLQGAGGAPRLYSGPVDAVRKIVKQEGFRGLYVPNRQRQLCFLTLF